MSLSEFANPRYQKQAVIISLIFLMAAVPASSRDKKGLVAERVATQNALFDEQYESDLREFPERATDFGDYRYNDKLADGSLAAITRREKLNESFLRRLLGNLNCRLLRPGPAFARYSREGSGAADRGFPAQRIRNAD